LKRMIDGKTSGEKMEEAKPVSYKKLKRARK
jgi:hypothetical protein